MIHEGMIPLPILHCKICGRRMSGDYTTYDWWANFPGNIKNMQCVCLKRGGLEIVTDKKGNWIYTTD
jgi:hypothetical protein